MKPPHCHHYEEKQILNEANNDLSKSVLSPIEESRQKSMTEDILSTLVPAIVNAIQSAIKKARKDCQLQETPFWLDQETTKNKPTNLSVLLLNAISLKTHAEDIEAIIHCLETPPILLCLTETWLNENDDLKAFVINGYTQYRSESHRCKGERGNDSSYNECDIIEKATEFLRRTNNCENCI